MSDNTTALTPQQEKAIAALLTAPTIRDAAAKAGCSERTLQRWLDLPAVDEAYRAARRKAVQQAVARLQRASALAVATLESVMGDTTARGSDRVAAAKIVLDAALKGIELDDIDARLRALEEAGHAQ